MALASAVEPRAPSLPTTPRIDTSLEANKEVPQQVQEKINRLFEGIREGRIEGSFRELFHGTQFQKQSELSDQILEMAKGSIEHFGNISEVVPYSNKSYGSRIIRTTHLTLHPKKQLRWQFVYCALDGSAWQLINLNVDDLRHFLPDEPITSQPPASAQIKLEKFFLSIQNRQVRQGFELLLEGTGLVQQPGTMDQFIGNIENAISEYGAMNAYELYDNRPLGLDIRLLTFIAFLRDEPLRWQFFYRVRSRNDWEIINLRVDDLLDDTLVQ
ncbi:MAG: hypothetical protein AAF984_03385 [Verrucomicrobiota bacterium]